MKRLLFIFLAYIAQACASNVSLQTEDRFLLQSIQYEKSANPDAPIIYRGPGQTLARGLVVAAPGVATGLILAASSNEEEIAALNKVALENELSLNSILAEKFQEKIESAGKGNFVEAKPRLILRIKETRQGFAEFMNNPDYQARSVFELSDGDRIVWRYEAQAQGKFTAAMPAFRYQELLEKENLRKVFETAAASMVADALQDMFRDPGKSVEETRRRISRK